MWGVCTHSTPYLPSWLWPGVVGSFSLGIRGMPKWISAFQRRGLGWGEGTHENLWELVRNCAGRWEDTKGGGLKGRYRPGRRRQEHHNFTALVWRRELGPQTCPRRCKDDWQVGPSVADNTKVFNNGKFVNYREILAVYLHSWFNLCGVISQIIHTCQAV